MENEFIIFKLKDEIIIWLKNKMIFINYCNKISQFFRI